MASASPHAAWPRAWALRITVTAGTALIATPLAGAVGGAVLFVGAMLGQVDTSMLLLASFLFYGALIGSLIAAPVTLVVLPAACLLLHARSRLSCWLLPVLGLLAGVMRSCEPCKSISFSPDAHLAATLLEADHTMLLASGLGGMAAGLLFAWLPRAMSPNTFP